MIWVIIAVVLFLIGMVYMYVNKIHVDYASFAKKTLYLERGKFGVYCYTGKQGSGKTYGLVRYILKHKTDSTEIYSNITIEGLDYKPIESLEHLLSLRDKTHCFIIYDEIFTILQKQSKISADLMEFLTQQRKVKNIFFTTAQEWLEIPITFRRFVRIQVECSTIPLGAFGGILLEKFNDGYGIKWSQLDNEYVAPLLSFKVAKYEKKYMTAYDTYERIHRLN